MVLDDVADRIVTLAIATAKGTDLFKHFDPGYPDTAITLYERPGGRPIDAMGSSAKVVEQVVVDVLVRSSSYDTAASKCNSLFKGLHKWTGTINSVRYLFIRAMSSPVDVGPDEADRTRLVIPFHVMKEVS